MFRDPGLDLSIKVEVCINDTHLHQVVMVLENPAAIVAIGMTAVQVVLAASLLGFEILVTDLALPVIASWSVSIAVVNVLLQMRVAAEVAVIALVTIRHLDERLKKSF